MGENWWGDAPTWSAGARTPKAAARQTLIDACGAAGHFDAFGEPLPDDDLFRRARVLTHPDHRGGDRSAWDLVEAAGRVLGLRM